jgi:hypothetical protein
VGPSFPAKLDSPSDLILVEGRNLQVRLRRIAGFKVHQNIKMDGSSRNAGKRGSSDEFGSKDFFEIASCVLPRKNRLKILDYAF